MDLSLILALGFGLGALLLGVAARRREERALLRSAGRTARAVAAPVPRNGIAKGSAAVSAAGADRDPEADSPAEIPEIPVRAPEDRRKHPRVRSDQTFVVTPFAGRAMMAQCCDVSAGGMRFGVVGCTLRAGDLVRVSFNIGAETIAAIGSVLRIRELDPITSEVSIEFVRLDPWASQLLEQALEAEV